MADSDSYWALLVESNCSGLLRSLSLGTLKLQCSCTLVCRPYGLDACICKLDRSKFRTNSLRDALKWSCDTS
jgi:hypothetical protein